MKSNHKVTIMPKFSSHLPGENLEDAVVRVGSSFRGRAINKGLSELEEDMYLPGLIGLAPNAPSYAPAKINYWKNISRDIPFNGLELEVGFEYPNKKAYELGHKEALEEAEKIKQARKNHSRYDEVFTVRQQQGSPISIEDYVFYRYLLVYGDCANNPDDVGKSPKIRMYIKDDKMEKMKQVNNIKVRRKAMSLLIGMEEDKNKKAAVILLLSSQFRANGIRFDTAVDKEIALDWACKTIPSQFIAICEDETLVKKAFIMRALNANLLRRVPNTQTILHGDSTQIGKSMNEAVDWMFAAENLETLNVLKAQLAHSKK